MRLEDMQTRKISPARVWNKVRRYANQMGQQTVYSTLLMYYAFRTRRIPGYARNIVFGAFGYLIAPIDAIPDLAPILGFTDDLGVLSFALVTIASYINDDVRVDARRKVKSLFGEVDLDALQAVDAKL